MTRHRWSPPLRQSSELTIRTCEKCGLVWWSRHDWLIGEGRWGPSHWSEFYAESNPDVKLNKRPECQSIPLVG
jgi:hypothetical protein